MIMAMIVEDNKEDSMSLQKTLSDIWKELDFVVCEDGLEAMEYVVDSDRNIDIFFVDRDLPVLSGFDFAKKVRSMEKYIQTPIVFVTGFAMGQLDAFQEYHCYSYILKPFKKDIIRKHIGSLLEAMKKKDKESDLKKVVSLNTTTGDVVIYAKDIIGLEVLGRYCYLYTVKGRYQLARRPMRRALEDIDYAYLIQCHKSFALNIAKAVNFVKVRRNIWAPLFDFETCFQCEVSKTYYDEVINKYKKYLYDKNSI
ncbi:MAG: response regulator transcription factor [Clostridiales bacterium]|nr:response regulator transcription factor [Clostridiales bacterium]